jgi:hypothetical protein
MESCGAGGDTYGQRVRRDCSRSSGSAGRFAGCDSDSGQCVPICQRVQVGDGARHMVSAPTCRAIACPDFRTLDRVRRRSGSPVVVAATWETAPRLSGSRRARNRRSADDDRLAAAHLHPAISTRTRRTRAGLTHEIARLVRDAVRPERANETGSGRVPRNAPRQVLRAAKSYPHARDRRDGSPSKIQYQWCRCRRWG